MKTLFMTKVEFKISRKMTDYLRNSMGTIGYPFREKISDIYVIPGTKINPNRLSK